MCVIFICMKYQKDTYSCGAAAVVNVLRCFGKKIPEKNVRAYSSTTEKDGTDEHGIIAALRAFGLDGTTFQTENKADACALLRKNFQYGPVIICTQNLQHWVTIIGMVGDWEDSYIVVDPARTIENKKENGVRIFTKKQLLKTWQARNGKLFGIACSKKK